MTVSDGEYLSALCRNKFDAFVHKGFGILHPGLKFDWNWHIDCIAEHLEAVFNGEIRKLAINEPPRCLKSEEVAQLYPAWVLGKKPNHQIIGASYAGKLAKRNVVNTRKIMRGEWYRETFTDAELETEAAEHFTTTRNGQYMGAGLTGTITGFGADTLIIDDPLNPYEAASDTVRNSTLEWIRSTLFSRYNDERTASTVMIMQRVHDDDPTGNLLRDGGWHHLSLPAEFVKKTFIEIRGRSWTKEPGDLLFADRLSRETLKEKEQLLGTYNYAGQYNQSPVPLGGGEFKDGWVQFYHQGGIKPKEMNIAILVDQAGGEELNKKKKKLSDWTAILVIGLAPDNNYYLLDAVRDRINPTERINTIFMMHRKWNELTGKPPKVGCEQIGLMTDTHYLNEKKKQDAYNFPVVPLGAGQRISKEERIRKLIPIMEGGRFYVPPTLIYVDGEGRKWDIVKEFLEVELKTFPKSRYDDIVDCASRILDTELAMTFPKPKVGTVAKAKLAALQPASQSWEDY